MALTDVVHRKLKTVEENKKDFYATPYALTETILNALKELDLSEVFMYPKIIEPCAGEGAIYDVLDKYFDLITTNDLFFDGWEHNRDFLNSEWDSHDICIMNPPYSMKDDFIEKAMEVATISVVILPSNVDNYVKMNEKFFSKKEYIGAIRTYPKFFMGEDPKNFRWGGNVELCCLLLL